MKKLLCLFAIIFFISCDVSKMVAKSMGNHYVYSYTLLKPIEDSTLHFNDDKMDFRFVMTQKEISFTAKNKSNDVLKIFWDDASIVEFGKAHKIIHAGVKFIDRSNAMPPTSIPPGSSIDDLAQPADNIYYREGTTYSTGGWDSKDMFPNYDFNDSLVRSGMKSFINQQFSLYLPIKNTSGQEVGYTFTFSIKNVICETCNSVPSKKGR